MVADAPCRTKPIWGRGPGLRSAECGLKRGTVVRNKAKSRQDGVSRKGRTLPVGEPCRRPDRAKQSQYRSEVSSLTCEVSGSTVAAGGDPGRGRPGHMVADAPCRTKPICPAGQMVCMAHATSVDDSAKQSQSGKEVSGLKCEVSSSTPAHGGDPSRGRLGYMAADPSCETKPICPGR
jgi:hypothetical protein